MSASVEQAISQGIAGLNPEERKELRQVAVDALLAEGIGVATAGVAAVRDKHVDLGIVTYEIQRQPELNEITGSPESVVLAVRSREYDYQLLLSISAADLQQLLNESKSRS